MQAIVLALVATVLLPRALNDPNLPPDPLLAVVAGIGPALVVAVMATIAARQAARQFERGDGEAPSRMRRRLRLLQWTAVGGQFIAVFAFGWLGWIRLTVGDLPGADELLALLPPIAAIAACWWAAHPLESALRGLAVSRSRYVLGEFRNQFSLIGAPALMAISAAELLERAGSQWLSGSGWYSAFAMGLVPLMAVLLVPALMVRVLDTVPMEKGRLRSELEQVIRDGGVNLRGIRVWRTGGALLNGAVLGIMAPIRYLLLTDAVLELMPSESLRAIVAHEVGHLRRHHLPWLIVVMIAVISALAITAELLAPSIAAFVNPDPIDPSLLKALKLPLDEPSIPESVEVGLLVGIAVTGLIVFGWVSRRFERQADAFAVQYMSAVGETAWSSLRGGSGPSPEDARITAEAVLSMCRALGRVAELNGVRPTARSWRHGSIQRRQQELVSLVSMPIRRLPIDRQVRAIKLGGGILLVVVLAAEIARSLTGGAWSPAASAGRERPVVLDVEFVAAPHHR